MPGRKCLKIRK